MEHSQLFPESSDVKIANKCIGFFSRISQEYTPLGPPLTGVASEQRVELHEISARLRDIKKPKSRVKGDIEPTDPSKPNRCPKHLLHSPI